MSLAGWTGSLMRQGSATVVLSLDADTALFDHLFAVNTRAPDVSDAGWIRHLKERKAPARSSISCRSKPMEPQPILAVWCYEGCVVPSDKERRFFAQKGSDSRERHQPWLDGYPWRAGDAGRQAGKRRIMAGEAESRMPWGRLIQPEDVARLTMLFLLSRRFDSDDRR
jgi:hypothetical protein